ncbi:GNAT family N-acetyltransferase [Sphingosinicella sp. CPCC 101087]|uniref:GNAT family N-acetyltransferase n=1 Tax=Sphingosinicella sp. CPCC 101087 TaxID=2497754 RepID=UPI0013EB7D32|nr:GNAT family N-acetyltransferase [Sphingosinicella sp. CPCC 101087]
MSKFIIRPEQGDADRSFIREMNARLSAVIDAPTHSKEEVVAFQDRFTASSCNDGAGDSATFLAVLDDGQRLGYVNVRESADEIANERCGYIALLAVVADAESGGVGQSLLEAAERWAAEMGFSRIALDVFSSNARGRRFYEAAGFRPETIRLIKRL